MLRSMFVGILGLAALDAVVSSPAAAQRTGGLISAVSTTLAHILSPTLPAIPDLRHAVQNGGGGTADGGAGGGGGSSGGGGTQWWQAPFQDPLVPSAPSGGNAGGGLNESSWTTKANAPAPLKL